MMNPAEFANIAKSEEDFWWYRGMRRILYRILDPQLNGRQIRDVLEAGCGTGYFSRELEKRYGWRMFPLDLGREGLLYGRRMGIRRLLQGDICALPYAEASFDAVVSMDVIVHLPPGEEWKPMREMVRVLRPGGLAIVRVSALDILRSRHSQFAMERQRFTRRRLVALAAECGLRVLRCTYANSLLLPVALVKFRIWEPLTRQPARSGVEPVSGWLNTLLSFPLAVEAWCVGAGWNFPLGQSLVMIAERPRQSPVPAFRKDGSS